MQQPTSLARLCRRTAIPLTLLAQRTGTTTVNAGAIHHAQAAIGFSAVFMREQLLGSLATQRPIGLESKGLRLRSGPLSRVSPPQGEHSLRQEPRAVTEGGAPAQIRWCAPGQDEADAPVPGAGSRPIVRSPASTPVPRPSESTSDPGLARYPRLKAEAQRRRDADTPRPHRRR